MNGKNNGGTPSDSDDLQHAVDNGNGGSPPPIGKEEYSELAENLGMVYFSIDADLRYTYWNNGSEALTGIPREKALGKTITELFPETQGTEVLAFYKKCLAEQKPGYFENAFMIYGQEHFFEINAIPYSKGLMVFSRDITEKKQVLHSLRQTKDQFSTILNNNPTSYTLIDKDYKIRAFNALSAKHGLATFGHQMHIGQSIFDYVMPRDEENFTRDFANALSGHVTKKDRSFPLAQGGTAWFSFVYIPIANDDGEPQVLLSVLDITDRKKVEELVRESEEKFHSIFDNAPLGIFQLKPDGTFGEANRSLLEMFGCGSKEEVGRLMDIANESEVMQFYRNIGGNASLAAESKQLQRQYCRKDGSVFYANLFLKPIYDGSGQLLFVEGMVEDITQKKEGELKISQQNQDLHKLNKDLDILVHSISHDLKSPLSSAMGLLYLLKDGCTDQERDQYLGMMDTTLRKLNELIDDLLELSREKRAGKNIERINLEAMLNNVFEELSFAEGSSKVKKIIELENEAPLYSDPRRLKIIFGNLISNAIRYRTTRHEQCWVKIVGKVSESEVSIEVVDNGQGIPEAHQERIFEMFYRASQEVKGSGLGLYLVKEMVEKLGGTISVRSAYSKGSVFALRFPNGSSN